MSFRISAFGCVLLHTLALAGCGPLTLVIGIGPGDRVLSETVVESDGRTGGTKVAIVDVSGLIINAERPALLEPGENPVSLFHEKLRLAAADDHVRAVVLRLNTPGGAVTATDAMYRDLQRFREQTGKPVVALMMDVAASGGYYLACGADQIVAYPTAVTGSIGVLMQTFSVRRGLDKIGVSTEAIVSGQYKDSGSPFAPALKPDEREILQDMVDDFFARFVQVVRDARPSIPQQQFATLTDGRILSGDAAAQSGLVDATGDLYDAFTLAKSLAKIDRADLVLYHRPLDYVGSPYAAVPGGSGRGEQPTQINLAQLNIYGSVPGVSPSVGFFYLWQPSLD